MPQVYIYIKKHVCTGWYGQSDSCHQSDFGICMLHRYIGMFICMFTIHTHAPYIFTHAKIKHTMYTRHTYVFWVRCLVSSRASFHSSRYDNKTNNVYKTYVYGQSDSGHQSYSCIRVLYIYSYMYVYIYTHTRTHMCTDSWYRRLNPHICMSIYTHARVHICAHAPDIEDKFLIYVCLYIHTHAYAYVHIYI